MIAPPIPKHECNAIGCRRQILLKFLMCFEHWAMVRPALQKEVWSTYHDGMRKQTHPTREYAAAVQAAINAVKEAEGPKAVQLELC
jgi:hypothetical protein